MKAKRLFSVANFLFALVLLILLTVVPAVGARLVGIYSREEAAEERLAEAKHDAAMREE